MYQSEISVLQPWISDHANYNDRLFISANSSELFEIDAIGNGSVSRVTFNVSSVWLYLELVAISSSSENKNIYQMNNSKNLLHRKEYKNFF